MPQIYLNIMSNFPIDSDEEIISAGMIGAPLDGVFCVKNLEGDVILEKV